MTTTTQNILIGLGAFAAGAFLFKSKSGAVGAFKRFSIKMPSMRKEDSFLIYPYSGGDTVLLQSNKRIMRLNLRTGETTLSKSHPNGSYAHHLYAETGAINVLMPAEDLIKIQEYLWNNSGMQTTGVITIENKELFSE